MNIWISRLISFWPFAIWKQTLFQWTIFDRQSLNQQFLINNPSGIRYVYRKRVYITWFAIVRCTMHDATEICIKGGEIRYLIPLLDQICLHWVVPWSIACVYGTC